MYTFDSRVRYSETDESGKLGITGIMNYLQDCSTFQSEDLGLGIDYLKSRNRAWWLNAWQIEVDRYPRLGEEIVVGTWAYGFKGIYGLRDFSITDRSGNDLVRADSRWFFYDTKNGCPVRVTEDDIRGYCPEDRKLSMSGTTGKIKLPEYMEEKPSVRVERHHLDTNFHVNNAQYVELAREYLPENFTIRRLRAEYKKAAVLGDEMVPAVAACGGDFIISLRDGEKNSFANLWFGGEDGKND